MNDRERFHKWYRKNWTSFGSEYEAADEAWQEARRLQPMEAAPKDGTPIVALCKHEADPYFLEDGKMLTTYGAHCEGMSQVPNGWHVVQWGGAYNEYDDHNDRFITIPEWWFRVGSDFEEAANPVGWLPLPPDEQEAG